MSVRGWGAAHTPGAAAAPGVSPGDRRWHWDPLHSLRGQCHVLGHTWKVWGVWSSPGSSRDSPRAILRVICASVTSLVPCASHPQGFQGSPIPRAPSCPSLSPPSLSPPSTLKVLKVKYYRLLCCCLTTTDKLRTSCQNVSAQQINIQNESQRYVVYN